MTKPAKVPLLAQPPSFQVPRSSSSSLPLPLPRMRPEGSRGQAQTPPRAQMLPQGGGRGTGGSHHARGQAPWRPVRTLPRPGPHAPISEEPGRCGWEKRESKRMPRELRLDRCWAREEGQRPSICARLPVVLALPLPAGFRGNGLVTVLPTFGPVVAMAPSSPSNSGISSLSWRLPIEATPHPNSISPRHTGPYSKNVSQVHR